MNRKRGYVKLVIDRKAALLLVAVMFLIGAAGILSSQQLSMTATYPIPAGVYNQIVTTGNSGVTAANTTLNRNAGNTILVPNDTNATGKVGIGTTSPGFLLDIAGTAALTNLQVNGTATEGAACTSNGLVARDSTGLLLSCQTLVWKQASGAGGGTGLRGVLAPLKNKTITCDYAGYQVDAHVDALGDPKLTWRVGTIVLKTGGARLATDVGLETITAYLTPMGIALHRENTYWGTPAVIDLGCAFWPAN